MPNGTGKTRGLSRGLALLLAAALAACGGGESKQEATPPSPTAGPADTAQPADAAAPAPLQASGATWTPEQLEDLAAPVALFPDPVLAQVLLASANPQEVLDAGNWLLQNEALEGKALDAAAEKAGFTPPTRALIQFPQVIDMMCLEMAWTTDLGQAFVDDQAGLLDAVQRLRAQAMEVGNLQSSEQMKAETTTQDGEEVVLLSPPSPEVVYVPQYDPVAAYAPPPAAPATTTTTTTQKQDDGYSGGQMVATGLLAFGAGLLVAEVFDDDDDDWYHHHNYYGYGGMPYYPPYPYRPAYGGGYYPSHGYNRPPNYGNQWGNNNTVIINQDNNYWNRYDGNQATTRERKPQSPITNAKKTRPELQSLNAEAKQGPKRQAPATAEGWKGESGYAGAKKDASTRVAGAKPGAATRDVAKTAPKVQGSYAGARDVTKPAARPATKPAAMPSAKPAAAKPATAGTRDRGYTKPAAKPAARPTKPTAVSGASRQGAGAQASSQRGKQSMPKGVPSKARSGGKQKAGR